MTRGMCEATVLFMYASSRLHRCPQEWCNWHPTRSLGTGGVSTGIGLDAYESLCDISMLWCQSCVCVLLDVAGFEKKKLQFSIVSSLETRSCVLLVHEVFNMRWRLQSHREGRYDAEPTPPEQQAGLHLRQTMLMQYLTYQHAATTTESSCIRAVNSHNSLTSAPCTRFHALRTFRPETSLLNLSTGRHPFSG